MVAVVAVVVIVVIMVIVVAEADACLNVSSVKSQSPFGERMEDH